MVIFAPSDFFDSAELLRALHEESGLATAIVDIQDVYDEYSFGSKEPAALQRFLKRAFDRWQTPPRFVLLAGDGSYDPRDYLGFGDDIIPTKLIDTATFETASDDWFADFDGDGVPEMAVGRLPVRTKDEAGTVISKIVAHQSSGNGISDMVMVADLAVGDNFSAINNRLQMEIPQGIAIHNVEIDELGMENGRVAILDALRGGADLVNYSGHGTVDRWHGGLLTTDDAGSLDNAHRLPVFAMMNCLNGAFHEPLLSGLGEVLIREPDGGAAAVWASSAITESSAQEMLMTVFYEELFAQSGTTIGEAAVAAKAAIDNGDVRRTWILLGDPAMVMGEGQ